MKPPSENVKSTSGPSTTVKPVPQPVGSRQDSTHKSSYSQPSTGASKGPQTQSTKVEPPKTLPKPPGGNKATKSAPGKEGYGQALASQKTDTSKPKPKDNASESVDKKQPTQSRMMTRPLEKSQHPVSSGINSNSSAKGAQMSKSEGKTHDQMSLSADKPSLGDVTAKQGQIQRDAAKAQPQKTANIKSMEQRKEQPATQSPKSGSLPPSQFKPYPKAADNVTNKPLPNQQHLPLSQQSGVVYGDNSKTAPGRGPAGGRSSLPQTTVDVKQQVKQDQWDAQKQQQHSHQFEQKKTELGKHSHEGDKHQLYSEGAAKPVSTEQQTSSNSSRRAPQTQAKSKESQPSGEIRPHGKNTKAKSPKPSQKRADLEEGAMCPLCTSNELTSHTASLCNVCETNICLNCGSFETSPRTKVRDSI